MMKKTSDKSNLIKVNAATAIAVLAMHVGIAAALVHMQGPKPIVKKPEEVKPIEIQMLSMQEAVEPPSAVQPEQNTPQVSQEQVAKVQSQTKPASKPEEPVKLETKPVKQNKTEPEVSEPQTKSEPPVKPEPIEEAPAVKKSDPEPQLQTEPETDLETDPKLETDLEIVTKIKKTPIIDDNEHQRLIEQAAREKVAQEKAAQEKAAQEKAAREQAAREQAAREQAAREQAAREQAALEKAALEKAAQEKAAQEKAAVYNTPRSFSESQARWKRKPKLILPQQVDRRARLGEIFSLSLEVIVDKQGNVTKVTVTKSSGNQIVDNATVTEVKRSKLHPFTEDNLPVVGKIILPVEYVKK